MAQRKSKAGSVESLAVSPRDVVIRLSPTTIDLLDYVAGEMAHEGYCRHDYGELIDIVVKASADQLASAATYVPRQHNELYPF